MDGGQWRGVFGDTNVGWQRAECAVNKRQADEGVTAVGEWRDRPRSSGGILCTVAVVERAREATPRTAVMVVRPNMMACETWHGK